MQRGGKILILIYNIKQTLSYAILAATLFLNSTGHLLHKTNPDVSYLELSYVTHNYIIGRGTTLSLLVTKLFTNLCFKDIYFLLVKTEAPIFQKEV